MTNEKVTSETFLSYLKKQANENGKFYFASGENSAESIVAYFENEYDTDILKETIEVYCKTSNQKYVTVSNFVQEFSPIVRKIKARNDERAKFRQLLKDTKKRMEELDES